MTSDCISPIQGAPATVRSDAGWTGSLKFNGDYWLVDRDIPNWEPCPDGTAATGPQKFCVLGVRPTTSEREQEPGPARGLGKDQAPSGACGINKPLVTEMPVRLEKLS